MAEWPGWLLEEAMAKPRLEVWHNTLPSSLPPNKVVAELTKALFKLDPVQWRSEGSQESCDQWLWLMIACKAVGISREDWIDWCAGDEWYAGAGDEIGRKWDGVVAAHSDALFKALAAGGIRLSRGVAEWRSVGLPQSTSTAKFQTPCQSQVSQRWPPSVAFQKSIWRWIIQRSLSALQTRPQPRHRHEIGVRQPSFPSA